MSVNLLMTPRWRLSPLIGLQILWLFFIAAQCEAGGGGSPNPYFIHQQVSFDSFQKHRSVSNGATGLNTPLGCSARSHFQTTQLKPYPGPRRPLSGYRKEQSRYFSGDPSVFLLTDDLSDLKRKTQYPGELISTGRQKTTHDRMRLVPSFMHLRLDPEKVIQQAPIGKKQGSIGCFSSSSNLSEERSDQGTCGASNTSRAGDGFSEDRGNEDQQGGNTIESVMSTRAMDGHEPLRIAFVGQCNSGKSSLANCLLGIDFFPRKVTETESKENDFILPKGPPESADIVIRSLPGYGGLIWPEKSYLDDLGVETIIPSEIVVMVMGDSMDRIDEVVLKALIKRGHPPGRILFVRNKFAPQQQVSEIIGDEGLETSHLDGLTSESDRKEKMQKEHAQSISIIQGSLEQEDPVRLNSQLIFTNSKNVSTFSESHYNDLVSSISRVLTTDREKTVFYSFKNRRPQNIENIKHYINERFKRVFENEQIQSDDVFRELLKLLKKSFSIEEGEQSDDQDTVASWLCKFEKLFDVDFQVQMKYLRDLKGPRDSRDRETLQTQFYSFYIGHLFGVEWYHFIWQRQQDDTDDMWQTPLHQWAREGRPGWVWLWLQLHNQTAGELMEVKDQTAEELMKATDINGRTPLHLAVYSGDQDTVNTLLELGAEINARDKVGYTPLHWAAWLNQREIAKLLLKRGGGANQYSRERLSPLHLAAWRNHPEVIKELLNNGANRHALTYQYAMPFHYAALAGNQDSLSMLMKDKQTNVDYTSANGFTALHLASWNRHCSVIDYLANLGANRDACTDSSDSADKLYSARRYAVDHPRIHDTNDPSHKPKPHLLDLPIPPIVDLKSEGVDEYGFSPIHRAVREGNANSVEQLCRGGQGSGGQVVNQQHPEEGWTPLQLAVRSGHSSIAYLLHDKLHADQTICDRHGRNPSLSALAVEEFDLAKHLLSALVDHPVAYSSALHFVYYDAARYSEMERSALRGLFDLMISKEGNPWLRTVEAPAHAVAAKHGKTYEIEIFCKENPDPEEIRKALHVAAVFGHAPVVEKLKDLKVDPDGEDCNGWTALHKATMHNHLDVIDVLTGWANPNKKCHSFDAKRITFPPQVEKPKDKGSNFFPDSQSDISYRITALHLAAQLGYTEAVKRLCEIPKANVQVKDDRGWTPLHYAAFEGHTEIVDFLTSTHKVNPNVTTNVSDMRRTPLVLAIERNHTTTVDVLKTRGGNIKQDIGIGIISYPAWLESLQDRKLPILRDWLENKDLSPNQKVGNGYPLHFAASQNQPKVIRLLLQKGADAKVVSDWGAGYKTPMETAISCHHYEAVKAFFDAGCQLKDLERVVTPLIVYAVTADIEIMEDAKLLSSITRTMTPIIEYIVGSKTTFSDYEIEKKKQIIKLLLDKGASLEQKMEGKTPLHLMVQRGDKNMAKILLDLGACVDSTDLKERTALHLALINDDEPLIVLLLDNRANMEIGDNKGNTPLHMAATDGKSDNLRWLLDKGANPNSKNNKGETPLMLAAKNKSAGMVKTLLSKGAQLDIQDNEGSNGLHYIFKNLSNKDAETILHHYPSLITMETLQTKDKYSRLPVEMLWDGDFEYFVLGLTFPISYEQAFNDATRKGNHARLEMLEALKK